MMATSLWQEWNLFAPDPLRRVTTYEVDVEEGLNWKTVAVFGADSFPWWRNATYAKLLPGLLDAQRLDFDVFRERFLQLLCRNMGMENGTMVRLRESVWVIPYIEEHKDKKWWRAIHPPEETSLLRTSVCSTYIL